MGIEEKQKYNKSLSEQLTKLENKITTEKKSIDKYIGFLSSYGYVYDEIKNNKYKVADTCVEAYFLLCDIENIEHNIEKYKERIDMIKNKIHKNNEAINKINKKKDILKEIPPFFTSYEVKLGEFIGDTDRAHKTVVDLYSKIIDKVGEVLSTSEVAFNGCEMFGIIRGKDGDIRISSVLITGDKKMLKHYRYTLCPI